MVPCSSKYSSAPGSSSCVILQTKPFGGRKLEQSEPPLLEILIYGLGVLIRTKVQANTMLWLYKDYKGTFCRSAHHHFRLKGINWDRSYSAKIQFWLQTFSEVKLNVANFTVLPSFYESL